MQQQWQIRLFGGLCAEQGERVIHRFRTQKTRSLLAYLACFSSRAHPREVLMELLWPESSPDAARHNLRMALCSLRRQLEPPGFPDGAVIRADRASIALNPLAVTTDVAQFEAAVRFAQSQSDAEESPWISAIELYTGRLLEGCYEDWVAPEQRRLEELFFGVQHELVARLERNGDCERALHYAQRGANVDPLRESAQRDLMRLYAAVGQPVLALRQYHELRRLLCEQLEQEPDAATTALAARIKDNAAQFRRDTVKPTPAHELETARFSDPKAGEFSAPNPFHLPLQFTRFFGREAEIARLHAHLLAPDARLITLFGLGGCGKTRLALETLSRLKENQTRWPGGVWFVPLADLGDADLLAPAILDALRLRPAPDLDPFDEAADFLARCPTLLLLDSFEPLVQCGAPILQRLLKRVPHLCCLVTSRQTLQLAGERTFAVEPLPVPEANQNVSPEKLVLYDSVQLFTDRARAVQPDFQVTRANAPVVAQLCGRLEGVPLAIELAAARVGVLTPARMLGLIEHRFEFLVSRQRGVTTRHRTLQNAIAWSYHLLEADLQWFFARLSVFRGGWTLEAAQFVGEEPRALDRLEQLRECSLVLAEEREGEMRFRLLDSIREYGAEQLDAEARAQLERRHAEFFVALAEAARPELFRPHPAVWMTRLSAEPENLRAALEWSLNHEPELALRGASALVGFWERRGQTVEARSWLERAMQLSGAATPRAKVWLGAGRIALVQGDMAASRSLLETALAQFRALDDAMGAAASLHELGIIAVNSAQFEWGRELAEKALKLRRQNAPDAEPQTTAIERKRGLAEALCLLGTVSAAQGGFEAARPSWEESAALFRALEDDCGLAYTLDLLGQSAHRQGETKRARALLDESLRLFRAADERTWICRTLWGRANLARDEGDEALARSLYAEAVTLSRSSHNRMALPYLLEGIAVMTLSQGWAPRAARLLGAAHALREATGVVPVPFWCADCEKAVAAARSALGRIAFEKEWAAGLALDWQRAAVYALEEM